MKEEATPPVEHEAKPLFVGGEAKKPKLKRRWGRVIVLLAIVVVLAGGFAGWWFFLREDPNDFDISTLNSQDRFIALAKEFADQPVPKAPRDQALYYGNIALALKKGKEYKYSERYYLKAQDIVDDNNVDKKDVEFYMGLSDLYKAMGNQKKADEYSKKEQDFLKANYSPEVLKQMQEVKLNDPAR